MTEGSGRIIEIKGGVIDAEFPVNDLPNIYEALIVKREDGEDLVLEVENHLGAGEVRCVAMVGGWQFRRLGRQSRYR